MNTFTPPQDIEAEEAVLGSVLLSNVSLPKLIVDVGLTDSAFYRDVHGRIWNGMVALAMSGDTVDEVTLRGQLESAGLAKEEVAKIDVLPAAARSAGAVLTYARRVMDLAEWRQILMASVELQVAVAEQDSGRRHEAERMLTNARRRQSDTYTPEALRDEVWRHLQGHAVPSWATPWPSLNDALGGGLRAGEVTLLGGYTSMGKSVVTDQLLRWCADKGAKTHAYINEMAPIVRALRVLSSTSGVPQAKLVQPAKLESEDHAKIAKHLGHGLPFGITQVGDWSADDIARDIRFRGWDVCALDLVHRLAFSDERDLARISTTLNAAAQMSGAHLIAVVHLNQGRAVGSLLPPPVLRDIRGSGMLANDTDNVLFIHRDEEEGDAGITFKTMNAALYLAKCRNGRLEKVDLEFDPRRSRFLEPAGDVLDFERRAGSDRGA
ncbi:MAG TPA: DnaB-like helicase C-terminal domain-containing protein [Solirubrobacteraceae bacterium]|jgi:replicative DNA helicase|nr:DnaB-like helicase C-terminal domain-containing protein [Solirubrobacteraceae bacterium]